MAICLPVMARRRAVLMSPMSFLQRPARWMQLLASNSRTFSAAPNFAFELAVRRTTDDDLAGLDLGNVLANHQRQRTHSCRDDRALHRAVRSRWVSPRRSCDRRTGSRRQPCTWHRPQPGRPPKIVRFDYPDLSDGQAKPCGTDAESGTDLVSHGTPQPGRCAHRQPGNRNRKPGRRHRRDLGARPQRRHALLAQS